MCLHGIKPAIAEAAGEAVCGIMVRPLWYVWDGVTLQPCRNADVAREVLATACERVNARTARAS